MNRSVSLQINIFPWYRFVVASLIILAALFFSRFNNIGDHDISADWTIYHTGYMLRLGMMIPYMLIISGVSVTSPFARLTQIHTNKRTNWYVSQLLMLILLTALFVMLYEVLYITTSASGFHALAGYPYANAGLLFAWMFFFAVFGLLMAVVLENTSLAMVIAFVACNTDMTLASVPHPASQFALLSIAGFSYFSPKNLLLEYALLTAALITMIMFSVILLRCKNLAKSYAREEDHI